MSFHTRFRVSYIIIYSCGRESSRDLVRDIVWNFARSRTNICVLNTMEEVS